MIVVEGPDGAGKSTLVEQLTSELGLTVGERGTADRDKLYEVTRQDTYTALSHAVKGDEAPQIWDRLFFSEMVYAPVVERECEFSTQERIFVKRVLTALGCPVVVCMPPWEAVRQNVEGTRQMSGVHENLETVYADYKRLFENLPWVMWYDYTGECTAEYPGHRTFDEILEGCRHYLEQRKEREW